MESRLSMIGLRSSEYREWERAKVIRWNYPNQCNNEMESDSESEGQMESDEEEEEASLMEWGDSNG